jgi:DNA-binding SARP family transcriptional activator
LQFRILGPVELRADHAVVPLGGQKPRLLLVALLLHANQAVSLDRLMEVLWESSPPYSATANFHTYVASLRRALSHAAPSGGSRLVCQRGRYLLRVEQGELDLLLFEDLCRQGQTALAQGDSPSGVQLLERGLALWRGAAAEDVPRVLGLAPYLSALDERRLTVLEACIETRLALGEDAALVPRLRALLAENPLRERAWMQLIIALYRSAGAAEALAAYAEARTTLVRELGIEPGPELRRLQQAVLHRDPALGARGPALPARAGTATDRPAAVGRVAERVTEATMAPHQLPRDAPFVGRAAELASLRALFDPGKPGCRTPTAGVYGLGGIGKSALAIHAAHLLSEQFEDGQLYVDLQGAQEGLRPFAPDEAAARCLRALGIPGRLIRGCCGEAVTHLRSVLTGRQLLLLLDNATDAAQVLPLMPARPGCAVLISSRQMLPTVDGAVHLGLDVLAPSEAVELLGGLIGDQRLASEPAAAVELARLCGRLPLALRVVGARLLSRATWPLARLVERLADERHRLDELEFAGLSVRSCFQAGYGELRRSDARIDQLAGHLFRLLGVLRVTEFGLPLAASLLNASDRITERALQRIVDVGLLDNRDAGCYRLHSLLRLFAAERAVHEEPEAVLDQAAARAEACVAVTAAAGDEAQ